MLSWKKEIGGFCYGQPNKKVSVAALLVLALTGLQSCSQESSGPQAAPGTPPTLGEIAPHVMTYEQMRTAGWRTFEEMAPEDQAFLSRALGPSLYEIKEAKLLIKKASPATVRVNSAYRMDQTDSSRAVGKPCRATRWHLLRSHPRPL